MKERPIIFSADSVRAILDGRKTQTRRVVVPTQSTPKVAPLAMEPWLIDGEQQEYDDGRPLWVGYHHDYPKAGKWFACPHGQIGDRLWVREEIRGDGQPGNRRAGIMRYGADGEMVMPCLDCGYVVCRCESLTAVQDVIWGYRRPVLPAHLMPRWASRLTLEIVGVRVQRLADMAIEDFVAEGIEHIGDGVGRWNGSYSMAYSLFASEWDKLNAKRGYPWDSNPWVWVIEFKRLKP